jgi:hypothetical protein
VNQFAFESSGRQFHCERAASPATPGTFWWWITISGENQRYAAFRSEKGEVEAKLKPRVIAYYEQLLVDRARPPAPRQWAGRKPAVAAPDAAAAEVKVEG